MVFSLEPGSVTTRPAEEFVKASLAQLERLVIIYQRHFDNRLSSVLWHTGSLFVANAVIRDESAPLRELYFYRCLSSYKALYPRHSLMKLIAKGLLSMAVDGRLISVNEAKAEIRQFTLPGETESTNESDDENLGEESEPSTACFVANLDSMFALPEVASVEDLSNAFDDMVMFDRLIHSQKSNARTW